MMHSEVFVYSEYYDDIYNSEAFKDEAGQLIIVDSGCPRSLMGVKEYEMMKHEYEVEVLKHNHSDKENFRFGPSKSYKSEFKVRVPLKFGKSEVFGEFFVVDGNIPILLGNDFLKPMECVLNYKHRDIEIHKIEEIVPMTETTGGHLVLKLKNVAFALDYHENVVGGEANAVMTMIVSESENIEEMEQLHNEVGHTIFLSLLQSEKDQVKKIHRYFGHRSGRRVWDLLAKAKRLKGKRKDVLEVIANCKICSEHKKAPPRPKVGFPPSNDFNEVVGMDLKVVNKAKGEYILWMVCLFSKVIKGQFIRNKKPATIIQAIIDTWIVGGGIGPGHPSRGFWSDNGGEFLNDEMINFAAANDINIKMSAAESPWQNGIVERHHATCDIVFAKLMKDNPAMSPQEAVHNAAFSKNCEINRSKFSPLQLMMGQCPGFPGLAEANPSSSNIDSANKYMKTLKKIDEARVKYRQADCDEKLKKVISEKINPNVERFYDIGSPVFFYDQKKKQWKKGTALIRLGKTVYLRFGNYLRRVAVENVRPDPHGEEIIEDGYIEADPDDERFANVDTPVEEMEKDLELADQNRKLTEQVQELTKDKTQLIEKLEMIVDKPEESIGEECRSEVGPEVDKEAVLSKCVQKRMHQKQRKQLDNNLFPELGH